MISPVNRSAEAFDRHPISDMASTTPAALDDIVSIAAGYSRGRFLYPADESLPTAFETPTRYHWWEPEHRAAISSETLRLGSGHRRRLRNYTTSFDQSFRVVLESCAAPRSRASVCPPWITRDSIDAYVNLYETGIAHSVEVWENDELVGGLFGIAIGAYFSCDSMFSTAPSASTAALRTLADNFSSNQTLIDLQWPNAHVHRLGAKDIERSVFTRMVANAVSENAKRPPTEVDGLSEQLRSTTT